MTGTHITYFFFFPFQQFRAFAWLEKTHSGPNSSESLGTLISCLLEPMLVLALEQLKLAEFALSSLELSETLKDLIMMFEVSCRPNETQTPDGFNTIFG